MKESFEDVINSFIQNGVGVTDDFISSGLSKSLRENLLSNLADNKFHEAGIGNDTKHNLDKKIRGDKIYWLDREHQNIHENKFLDLIDGFIKYLNETCYVGITGCEFHYAYYKKGSFYKKHIDQFKDNNNRKYSLIIYLNENWKKIDGGELCVYQKDQLQIISPKSGKCVFFKSNELEHEVMLTQEPRLSITGWLKSK